MSPGKGSRSVHSATEDTEKYGWRRGWTICRTRPLRCGLSRVSTRMPLRNHETISASWKRSLNSHLTATKQVEVDLFHTLAHWAIFLCVCLSEWSLILAIRRLSLQYAHFFVQFYGWYESPGRLHAAMEYCEHGDLNKYIKSVGRLSEKETKDIIWQVLGGLSLMHEAKFAHRDIKPAVSLPSDRCIWLPLTGSEPEYPHQESPTRRVVGQALRSWAQQESRRQC